jgi:hypothetical protein
MEFQYLTMRGVSDEFLMNYARLVIFGDRIRPW